MAYYCQRRGCYVNKKTNRRYRGLAKHLKLSYFNDFEPPPGLGKRVGPKGYRAGKALDAAVTCIVTRKKSKTKIPKWAQKLGRKVVQLLWDDTIVKMTSQLVVCDNKHNYATAVDVCGVDASPSPTKYVIVELKYSSHKSSFISNLYNVPGRNAPRMQRCGLPNTMAEQHKMQVRATARLFCDNFKVDKSKVRALVVVAPYSGPLLKYPVEL